MGKLRVTTFNVENLFNRYAFLDEPFQGSSYERFVQAVGIASIASRKGDLVADATTTIQRNNTALAIEKAAPDVLAVQEVENVYALRILNEQYLGRYFRTIILLDGNDPRGIDVGFLVRADLDAEVLGIRSHIDDAVAGKTVERDTLSGIGYLTKNAVFSRDCLEVDLRVGGKELTFLVNHFKAQDQDPNSAIRRKGQAARVAELVDAAVDRGRTPIVLGDLNVDRATDSSLDPLLSKPDLREAPVPDGWTHFYDSKKSVSQLDYILVGASGAAWLPAQAEVVRDGLSTKCKQYAGPRFSGIGPVHTEASDHCPLTVELTF